MPPPYGTKAYWDARFQHEEKYEWLLPANSLNAVIREALLHHQTSGGGDGSAPQILHIGCGSSDLSFQLRDLVASPRQITNVDYSPTAVQKCRLREAAALSATTTSDPTSTCDAISCAEDVPVLLPFTSPRNDVQPRQTDNDNEAGAAKTALVHPAHLLAVHMAVLTPPRTGRWCALSYSDDRFSFMDPDSSSTAVDEDLLERRFPDPRRFWKVERKERATVAPPAAATGSGGHVVHQPEIAHWLYAMVRSNEMP
ncbi:hypothetical protein PG994_011945 [Apiospora phragmitis]|uniref:Methyltransferase domain-containing protein n=1 Tax=Apiospora phragmitis TaxID=2905665 RepID=A0ABR1TU76_9PEZI